MIGVVVAAVLSTGLAILRLLNADQVDGHDVVGSMALGFVLGLPAVLAWLSLDRRPSLLPAATYAAVVSGFLSSVFLPFWLVVAWLWYRAWNSRPVVVSSAGWMPVARVGLAAMVLVSFVALFVHRDPQCSEVLSDGTVREVDPATRGFTTGWTVGVGSSSTSSSNMNTVEGDVVSSSCESDRIVAGEALVSMTLAGMTIASAGRWPIGSRSGETETAHASQLI